MRARATSQRREHQGAYREVRGLVVVFLVLLGLSTVLQEGCFKSLPPEEPRQMKSKKPAQVTNRILEPGAFQQFVRESVEEHPLAFLSLQFPLGSVVEAQGLSKAELNGLKGHWALKMRPIASLLPSGMGLMMVHVCSKNGFCSSRGCHRLRKGLQVQPRSGWCPLSGQRGDCNPPSKPAAHP